MKKIIAVLVVCLLLTGCQKTVPKVKGGEEAVVTFSDGKKISTSKLYQELKKAYGTEKLIDLVDNQILKSKYSKKMDEAEKNAKENLDSIKNYYKDKDGNYDEASLLAAIKQYYGYETLDEFKESLKLNYLRSLATTDYAKTRITDQQMKEYYDSEIVGDRKVAHIQIIPKVKDSMTDKEKKKAEDKALQKAKDAIARLKKGEKFATVAKDVSNDEATKDKGGDLGYINKGDYGSTEFDNEVWKLEVGKYSTTPVKTESGYEIVYVTKEKEKSKFEKVKKSITKTLAEQLVASDATIQVSALEKMRKEAGLKIVDTDLNKSYKQYINDMRTAAAEQNKNNESAGQEQ